MASVSFDGENMTHYIAARNFPLFEQPITLSDSKSDPLVVCIGDSKELQMIRVTNSGENELVNLHSLFGFPLGSNVIAFAASQDRDQNVYFTGILQEQGKTVVYAYQPFDVNEMGNSMASYIMKHDESSWETDGKIKDLKMAQPTADSAYPTVTIFLTDLRGIKDNMDIVQLSVTDDLTSYSVVSDIELPENAQEILDVCPMSMMGASGLAVLYKNSGDTELTIMAKGAKRGYVPYVVDCREDTTKIATFLDDDDLPILLAAGGGLYGFDFDAIMGRTSGALYCDDDVFKDSEFLSIYQIDGRLTVWTINSAGDIGYTTTTSFFNTKEDAVLILPGSKGTKISPYINNVTGRQQFITLSEETGISMLHHDTINSGLWNTVPYFFPDIENTIEVRGYLTHCVVKDKDGNRQANIPVKITCQSFVQVLIKGRNIDIGPSGVEIDTDSKGEIDIILPSEALSTFLFTVQDADNQSYLSGQKFDINPSHNVLARLQSIQTKDGLKSAQTKDGTYLVSGFDDKTLDSAATAIKAILDSRGDLPGSGYNRLAARKRHFKLDRHQVICGHGIDEVLRAVHENNWLTDAWDSFKGVVEEGLKFVKDKVNWVISKAESGLLALSLTFKGTPFSWLCEDMAQLLKVADFVFNTVLDAAQLALEFLGFAFEWGDIKDTYTSLSKFFDDILGTSKDRITQAEGSLDGFFTNLKDTIRSTDQPSDPSPLSTGGTSRSSMDELMNKAPVNYMNYQLQHGGLQNSYVDSDQSGDDGFGDFFQNNIKPQWSSLEDDFKTLAGDFQDLFSNHGQNLTANQVFEKIKTDTLEAFIDALRIIASSGLYLAVSAVSKIVDFIKSDMNIPIISYLYQEFIGGNLSIQNAICLIIAVPATILYKTVTDGSKPPDLSSLRFGDMLDGKQSWDKNTGLFLGIVYVSAVRIIGILGMIYRLLNPEGIRTTETETLRERPARSTLDNIAKRRLRSELQINSMIPKKPARFAWKVLSFGKNPFARALFFIFVRGANLYSIINSNEDKDIHNLEWATWWTSAIVNVLDVLAYGYLARNGAETNLVTPVLLGLSALAEAGCCVLDAIVFSKASNRQKISPEVAGIGIASGVGFLISAVLDAASNIDLEPETGELIEVLAQAALAIAAVLLGCEVFEAKNLAKDVRLNYPHYC